jgi:OmpA-OmpF porin, OOP family
MNKFIRGIVGLACLAFALPVLSQTQETRPYAFGGYEYTFQDDSRDSDNGHGFFAGVGKSMNKYWGLELSVFHDRFMDEPGNPNDWMAFGGELDGLFFYSRDRRFQPYVGLGLGGVRNELRSGTPNVDSTDFMAAAGLGFFKYFDVGRGNFGIRGDVRYRWSDANEIPGLGNFNEPQVRVGLVLALGDSGLPAEGVKACADSDHDGVCDDADLCPNTPAGVKVNPKGCPLDSDGDGVSDDQDRCPGTSKGTAVDKYGCPMDDATGPNRKFEDVHFEFDHSDLTTYAKAALDSTATTINGLTQKYPKLRVELSGHTDWIGTDAYNQGLSERRANTVKQYLVRKGVDGSRISTYAYGEGKPVATNETAEGRALNRRTEIRTRGE